MFGNMKVNFNQFFKNYRGELLTVDNKPQSMKMVIAQSLFNGEGMKPTNDTLKDGEKKMRSYLLCRKIMESEGEISLSTEEAVLIKEVITHLTPGCYSQVVQLIDE